MKLLLAIPLVVLTLALPAAARVELQLQIADDPVAPGTTTRITALAQVESGWHVNAHKPNEPFLIPTALTLKLPDGVGAGDMTYPEPESKSFQFAAGKQLLVYEGEIRMEAPLTIPADHAEREIIVVAELRYQACNDTTCLPPRTIRAEATAAVAAKAGAGVAPGSAASGGGAGSPLAGIDFATVLSERGLALTLLLVLALGVGLNLTPCVYPLISVTIAYFGTQAKQNQAGVMRLALAYVFGITLTFSLVGVAAAFSGGIFGAALQQPAVLVFIASVLTLLALSSFGVYQLQPPSWLMQKAGAAGSGVVGAMFMGSTMGIVAAPCVGPVVIGLLVFVGSQQSVALGFSLFFALGLGLGLPYLVLARMAGSLHALPRSGDWLLWVERLFGFLLLGLAVYFVSPLLPSALRAWALSALVAVAGIYLGFVDGSGHTLPRFRTLQRAVGVAAVALAVWLAMPRPAESRIEWQPLELAAVAAATKSGRPVVIDFVADWCIPCHEMEATTWADTTVLGESARFAMFKADITQEGEHVSALIEHYEVQGVPTIIYLDTTGREVGRKVGYVGADEMLAAMRGVG
jgi:thiol:disulfide interchange protein DsbD